MDRVDKMIMKARKQLDPPLSMWEKAMKENPYSSKEKIALLDLLCTPHDDWRQIVQALAWKEGG